MPVRLFPYMRQAMFRWGGQLGMVAGGLYGIVVTALLSLRMIGLYTVTDFINASFTPFFCGAVLGGVAGAVWGYMLGHIMAEITEGRFDSIHVGKRHERWMIGTCVISTAIAVYLPSNIGNFVVPGYSYIFAPIVSMIAALAAGYAGWRVARAYAKLVQTEGNVRGPMA